MDGIGTVRIVCLANQRTVPIAFAIGKRLERVARSDLGPALERQVGPARAVRLGHLTVRLELDPSDYDDPTLALLWAIRIRQALVAATAGTQAAVSLESVTPPDENSTEQADSVVANLASEPGAVSVTARKAIAGDQVAATELAHAILGDPETLALLLWSQLSENERGALVRALEVSQGGVARNAKGATGSRSQAGRARGRADGSDPLGRQGARQRTWTTRLEAAAWRWVFGTGQQAVRSGTITHRNARRASISRGERVAPHEPLLSSDAGGLCFLWPWLTTHLEAATERLASHDPRDSRRLALAALLPDLPGAVDDAVVRLLAGDDISDRPSVIVVTEHELRLAAEGADSVLDSFAAALSGFRGSTPDFVRHEFLERRGVIDARTDPVSVRLAPKPLDPVISRLPYPIGMFRLPWTRPIGVHLDAA